MTSAAVYIITGTPYTVALVGGTNTFLVDGNYTYIFDTGSILTVLGGSPNGGYQQVVSSTISPLDPYFADVSILLHFDAFPFIDSSSNNWAVTNVGWFTSTI